MNRRITFPFFFILLFCTAFYLDLEAQPKKNYWARLQSGYGFCGSGDRNGYVGDLSAGRYFSPRFKTGLSLSFAGFDNGVYVPADGNKATVAGIELNAFYHIVNSNLFQIELGAGPHVQLWNWQYHASSSSTIYIAEEDILISPNQKASFDQTQIGYNVSLGLILTPISDLELGVWGEHQNGSKGHNISSIRAGIGIRF